MGCIVANVAMLQIVLPRPNRLWLADITYASTWDGWLYVAFILDVYSRVIVGWQIASHLSTELVLDALEMAIWRRDLTTGELIHHSDAGSQLRFKGSSQHCLVRESVGARRGPRLVSSSRGSCGAGCSGLKRRHRDRLGSAG
jgi:transposase InsO family protein